MLNILLFSTMELATESDPMTWARLRGDAPFLGLDSRRPFLDWENVVSSRLFLEPAQTMSPAQY